ncbi:Sepiapterin reductase [Dichotomocladium elegans]|nr:Sepiapterin reductase [Dichotomocladium elegans]
MISLYIITGANRGFGRAIAEEVVTRYVVAAKKVSLVLVGREAGPLHELAKDLQARGDGNQVAAHVIAGMSLDTGSTSCDAVLAEISKTTGPYSSATLINNAGTTGDLSKRVMEYSASEIQAYLNVNVASYVALVSGFLKLLSNRPEMITKTIVNISSLLAVEPFPHWGLYATGKAARDMLLRVVAAEQESVRTLSYAPGPLDNEMQKRVRETLGDAVQKQLYTDMANEGKLVSMKASAAKLIDLLCKNTFTSGAHIDFFDSC